MWAARSWRRLWEREFPADDVVALASSRSIGKTVSFGDDEEIKVQDLGLRLQGHRHRAVVGRRPSVSAAFAPKAAKAGAVVIDNTSHFRMDPDVPLVVPEVNPDALASFGRKNIIANPNCSTIQMVVALKPLHDLARIRRVVVSTYQSVSGAGKAGMDELFDQTKGIYVNDPMVKEQFTKQIAFNVIPHIDVFMEDGSTKEEWKMVVETKKILDPGDQGLGHLRAGARLHRPCGIGECGVRGPDRRPGGAARPGGPPGITVIDHRLDEGYVTPAESVGEDAVFVSRVREDPTVDNGLNFWCVSDNLRKGAALNAVQIAEILIEGYLENAA